MTDTNEGTIGGDSDHFKVVCIGPKCSGKSSICNFLANYQSTIEIPYSPTIGLRICMIEKESLKVGNFGQSNLKVELWDVSGDTKFSTTWNACAQDADGLLFCFNPDVSGSEKELLFWFNIFFEAMKLQKKCCLIFAHYKTKNLLKNVPTLPQEFENMLTVSTNIEKAGERIRKSFDVLLSNLIIARREKEEAFILK